MTTTEIREAFAKIAQPGQCVMIADLRRHLAGDRAEQDAALNLLGREDDVFIIGEGNQKLLTARERDGALWRGNQWRHCIQIG